MNQGDTLLQEGGGLGVVQPGTSLSPYGKCPADHGACPTVRILDRAVFFVRWSILPMVLVLAVGLIIFEWKSVSTGDLLLLWNAKNSEDRMVGILGALDSFLIACLVVMIMQGGYQIFIRRFVVDDPHARPQWLDRIDTIMLEVKVFLTIVSIEMIRVLKDFVELTNADVQLVFIRLAILVVCLLVTLGIAVVWWLMHRPSNHPNPAPHTPGATS